MSDFYSLLDLPVQLELDADSVEDAWRKLAKEEEEDIRDGDSPAEGDAGESKGSAVHEARRVLSDPFLRLEYWLELLRMDQPGDSPNSRQTAIDEDLMGVFSRVNGSINAADEAIKKQSEATTALGKAVVAQEAIAAQMDLQKLLSFLGDELQKDFSRFPEFEEMAKKENDFDGAVSALGRLRYVKKWEKECQDRLLALIALD